MPNNDYIKRSDALKAIQECFDKVLEFSYDNAQSCMNRIKAIPTTDVEPKQRWIPVTERPPEEPGEYIVAYHPCHWDFVEPSVKVGIDTFRGKTAWAKRKYQRVIAWQEKPEPPEEETVNEITQEIIEAAERNEKRIKETVDRIYDELIAEKQAEIERLEAEIAKMPPLDYEKLAANPPVYPANNGGCCGD